ncbi:uncharacterized protein LOC118556310 isoform X2 [Fundulus heteroclitus]|uniref:uncharacterized protein LOC118556310 isoform X2 n=1 Tax=Fundulus heteroclitus TaxID=8078 RepID=UPI00165CCCA7|nr:uncharacterized protein LOC118556310 isoform X2 [Fundulus heteroclitus]
METAVAMEEDADVAPVNQAEVQPKAASSQARRRPVGRRVQRGKRRGLAEKRRGQKLKRRGQEAEEGVTVKRTWGGKRRWDKKHYCVFCRRPQVKISRHLLRKHADQQEVMAAGALPTGSKQRHLLLEHLRCRGNYLHNIEVIRQGCGEIVPWRQPSEEVDARNYLPCPLCLGFFLRADLWRHQVSCRKKLAADATDVAVDTTDGADTAVDETAVAVDTAVAADTAVDDPAVDGPPVDGPASEPKDPAAETSEEAPDHSSEHKDSQTLSSEPGVDQNQNPGQNQPKKKSRVQAAASRLLPISSGASESCSEILHRMNQDNVSYEVKSDWLICKYGNKLMGSRDGSRRSYEYVSQKLRELGRLLLAAKSLDPDVQNLQDLLVPGQLSLALSAARKAAGYRWSRPPLSVKTTLKSVCEIAIGESLQDGDWEAAARTTDFYHMLGREWDHLGLQNPDPDPEGGDGTKKQPGQPRTDKNPRPDARSKSGNTPEVTLVPPESRPPGLLPVPGSPRKVRRRPWSSAEKDAIWRHLGVHVLLQTVPGKQVCQRCLDQEPVLRGRHWKDIKNQVHNQIQSQKKQQFHAMMDQEEAQQNQNQNKQRPQTCQAQLDQQKKHPDPNQHKQTQVEQNHQNSQYQKTPQHQVQVNHQVQNAIRNQKKQQDQQNQECPNKKQFFHTRLDHQEPCEVQMDHQNQQLQNPDTSVLPVPSYEPDGPLRAHGQVLLDREPPIAQYPVLHRALGHDIEPLLTRTDWTDEVLVQNYQLNRPMGRNLVQEVASIGPPTGPLSGHVQF